MATTSRRSGSDAAPPVPFSYAQAAKGLSTTPSATSKPSSGSVTPVKEAQSTPTAAPAAAVMSWADDGEANGNGSEKASSARELRTQVPSSAQKQSNAASQPSTSLVSSPDLGASSASTTTKDDDISSIPNTSSESTWENKSQTSTSVEKSAEPVDKASNKGKSRNDEKISAKPLQEAPVPVVNVWKQRAEEAKAKATQKPNTVKPTMPSSVAAQPTGSSQGSPPVSVKQGNETSGKDNVDVKEKAPTLECKLKGPEEEKVGSNGKGTKVETDSDRARKGSKARALEKEPKATPSVLPLPPDRDQESWPTPETAIDEGRKKAQEKSEKTEKERKETTASKPSGKKEWVNMAITPTVIFNTPLPNSAQSRRGGRGTGRGGSQGGGRSSGFGTSSAEKDGSAQTTLPNGDQPRRGRPDGSARDTSPKEKRTGSAGSLASKDKLPAAFGEKSSRSAASDVEAPSRRASLMTESTVNVHTTGQNNTFPRQYPSGRPNKGRRGEIPSQGERRKDGDVVSAPKENGVASDRRTSTATQTDGVEDSERRASVFPDGQVGSHSKQATNDRRFSSFSGRERGRGGGRGGRGNYQNGVQFGNGHMPPLKSSSTFPGPLSPTSFNPDQGAYFPAPSGRYRGNGPRSQSVTSDSVYRVPGYHGAHQLPPIHTTYMPNMYEYPVMQPLTAAPFNSFGVDHYTLFSMVTTQLEYYFSVENLCKDIFLRKHMDSQGFVFLNVIADFNRIKQLTTDIELIKLVCYQSRLIEFRIGHDGKDRLRRREGWEQWILALPERDPSAQNDGPDELYNPPIPHPSGFDQNGLPRYPEMPSTSPTAFGHDGSYATANGFHPGASYHGVPTPVDGASNGTHSEGLNGSIIPNGHPTDDSTKAVSGEPDSFSDEQVESLTVVVRKQDQPQPPALPPSAFRTFSNGSIDSRSGMLDESEKLTGRQDDLRVNSSSTAEGVESNVEDQPRRALNAIESSSTNPVRLYWVKDKDAPVSSLPSDSAHESYYHLRSKALQQRQTMPPGTCPYDMDVLYQFWSHFLIRNFNSRMYEEFRHFAFEDAVHMSDVGMTNLIKFYGESLLSSQNLIRERVARDYVELVQSESKHSRPAFKQLRSTLRNGALDPRNRRRIGDFLDAELKALLE